VGGAALEVHLVRRLAAQCPVRSVLVVPVKQDDQLGAQAFTPSANFYRRGRFPDKEYIGWCMFKFRGGDADIIKTGNDVPDKCRIWWQALLSTLQTRHPS
jgi:hypothetical protein